MIARLTAGALAAALASTAVALASAPTGSIKIQGPTSIALGSKFNETVSGHVSTVHRAYRIQMYEQTPASAPCSASVDTEGKRSYARGQGGGFIMQKSFSKVFHYRAVSPGTHRFCVYVARFINNNLQDQTLAHASQLVSYHS